MDICGRFYSFWLEHFHKPSKREKKKEEERERNECTKYHISIGIVRINLQIFEMF